MITFLRRWRRLIIYCALGFLAFAVFAVANFPYAATLTTMLAPFKLRVDYQSQHLIAPIGAELSGVKLVSTAGPSEQTLVISHEVSLEPALVEMLIGRPGLNAQAKLYGGSVHAQIVRKGSVLDLDFTVSGVDLGQIGLLSKMGAALDGIVSANGTVTIAGPQVSQNSGEVSLDARNVLIKLGTGFGTIALGTVKGRFHLDRGMLTIESIDTHGTDGNMQANGTVALAPELTQSTVDLKLLLNPTSAGRKHLGLFLGLLPHQPGSRPYLIRGPLMMPSVS